MRHEAALRSLRGIEIAYRLEGPADAPVVVFGNGLATTMAMWQPQADAFRATHRVLRYDVCGHGGTQASPPPYTLAELADDVAALLDALTIARATYVGLSLGGEIAQSLAVRHADRLEALVLCDTTMGDRRAMWEERIARVQAEGLEPQVEPAMQRWFTPAFRRDHPDLVEAMRGMVRSTAIEGYVGCAMAMRDATLREQTSSIRLPTLVITGEQDLSTPPGEAERLHRAIAGSRLALIAHAAHLPNIEQAATFNALLRDFLAARAPSA
ncbi:MAG: 3-oxoadipate enol-lactonase [Rhodospirillales bacterium]|nr:3-oxoadipate enol-lactonase [Rhodospirillales bacterium]